MTIEMFVGTPGSGKSYHILEEIIEWLDKGKHVIANFPLNFTPKMIRDGWSDRFMYIPDEYLMGENGMALLWKISNEEVFSEDNLFEKKPRFFERGESQCLVCIDESGNYFPPHLSTSPVQVLWGLFFRQHRKMGYDFILCSQGNRDINRTIQACVEYEIAHRKANRVFPFKYLPFTIFFYVRYWKADHKRQLLNSTSSIFVKKFAKLYNTHMMFGGFDKKMDFDFSAIAQEFDISFGNSVLKEDGKGSDPLHTGGAPLGEGPVCDGSESHNATAEKAGIA